jgi:hypothetical protein
MTKVKTLVPVCEGCPESEIAMGIMKTFCTSLSNVLRASIWAVPSLATVINVKHILSLYHNNARQQQKTEILIEKNIKRMAFMSLTA